MFKFFQLFVISLFLGFVSSAALVERQSNKDAYGFIYFTGEGLANGEQIYFAVSKTNSPTNWTLAKGGNPVLTSTLGTKGLRDPFIIRDPNSSKLFIVATDLRMFNGTGGNWDNASRHGSLSLAIWETTNLKTFSQQRLVKVSPATAGMSWAPEVTYDPAQKKFVVYWASKLYAESDTSHTGTSYARILYATTTDFVTFSAAKVWIDPGRDIIDTSVAFDTKTSTYHRFSKTAGVIVQEKSTTGLFGTWTEVARDIGQARFPNGLEGPLIFEDNLVPGKWHLMMDKINPQGYEPFESTNIGSGQWTYSTGYALPANPRHGTIFAISSTEAANLRSL